MKLTYSIWQGSLQKGTLTEVVDTINELNESGLTPKFEAFIHKLEGVNN